MAGRKHCKDIRSNPRSPNLIEGNLGDRDDPDDVMETSLTIDHSNTLSCSSSSVLVVLSYSVWSKVLFVLEPAAIVRPHNDKIMLLLYERDKIDVL